MEAEPEGFADAFYDLLHLQQVMEPFHMFAFPQVLEGL